MTEYIDYTAHCEQIERVTGRYRQLLRNQLKALIRRQIRLQKDEIETSQKQQSFHEVKFVPIAPPFREPDFSTRCEAATSSNQINSNDLSGHVDVLRFPEVTQMTHWVKRKGSLRVAQSVNLACHRKMNHGVNILVSPETQKPEGGALIAHAAPENSGSADSSETRQPCTPRIPERPSTHLPLVPNPPPSTFARVLHFSNLFHSGASPPIAVPSRPLTAPTSHRPSTVPTRHPPARPPPTRPTDPAEGPTGEEQKASGVKRKTRESAQHSPIPQVPTSPPRKVESTSHASHSPRRPATGRRRVRKAPQRSPRPSPQASRMANRVEQPPAMELKSLVTGDMPRKVSVTRAPHEEASEVDEEAGLMDPWQPTPPPNQTPFSVVDTEQLSSRGSPQDTERLAPVAPPVEAAVPQALRGLKHGIPTRAARARERGQMSIQTTIVESPHPSVNSVSRAVSKLSLDSEEPTTVDVPSHPTPSFPADPLELDLARVRKALRWGQRLARSASTLSEGTVRTDVTLISKRTADLQAVVHLLDDEALSADKLVSSAEVLVRRELRSLKKVRGNIDHHLVKAAHDVAKLRMYLGEIRRMRGAAKSAAPSTSVGTGGSTSGGFSPPSAPLTPSVSSPLRQASFFIDDDDDDATGGVRVRRDGHVVRNVGTQAGPSAEERLAPQWAFLRRLRHRESALVRIVEALRGIVQRVEAQRERIDEFFACDACDAVAMDPIILPACAHKICRACVGPTASVVRCPRCEAASFFADAVVCSATSAAGTCRQVHGAGCRSLLQLLRELSQQLLAAHRPARDAPHGAPSDAAPIDPVPF